MTTSQTALVILGHADRTASYNAALADAYARGWSDAGLPVERIDLGELRFDPVLRAGFHGAQELEPDLLRLRAAIERARHVTWVFPTYWASPPALVRGTIDRAFLPGWAFRYEEGKALPLGLLRGRSSRVITTMDSPSWWYSLAHRRSLQATMGTATLSFSGFAPVRFTTIHRLRHLEATERAEWLARVAAIARQDARGIAAAPKSLPARAS